jgi:hypothetical protein
MQIDKSDEQPENAESSIDESLEADSNVTIERDKHSEKQYREIRSTRDGTQIDESDEQLQNAESPTQESIKPYSNVAGERDRHP